MQGYLALIHAEDGSFGVSFPDVPGCISADTTFEGAVTGAREALSAHLAWMAADGDAIPKARSLEELRADPEVVEVAEDAMWHLIFPRVVQAPRVRVNVMIAPALLREADERAEAEGMTRSGLIEAALRYRLAATGQGTVSGSVKLVEGFRPELVGELPAIKYPGLLGIGGGVGLSRSTLVSADASFAQYAHPNPPAMPVMTTTPPAPGKRPRGAKPAAREKE